MLENLKAVVDSTKLFENSDFGTIRTCLIDGEPWFVGNDVASILGYKSPKDTIRMHVPEKDRSLVQLSDIQVGNESSLPDHMKGVKITIINESGLYRLILRSNMPNAEKFSDWVTSEVIPSIRKTGSYSLNKDNESELDDKLKIAKFQTEWVESLGRIFSLDDASKLALLNKSVKAIGLPKDLLPLPDYIEKKKATLSLTDLLNQKGYKLSAKAVNVVLEERGIIETKTRKSTSNPNLIKKFKMLTKEGLNYGINYTAKENGRDVQPLYFDDKFEELMDKVGIYKK